MNDDNEEYMSDRPMRKVVAPPRDPLTWNQLFTEPGGLPNLEVLKKHLLREGRVTEEVAMHLVSKASDLLAAESNVLELSYPITVCGDVHGQFFDLVRLFEVGGDPGSTQYLFLGDYVDRGCFSTEVVFYLFAMKITYPKSFFMLRGNHECRQLTAFFNFKDECSYKYNLALYDAIMASFDNLPLAAIVNKSFFCVHGGLSPKIASVQDVKNLDRKQEIPREGPMCDLLWSDPYEVEKAEEKAEKPGFNYNETRQCSVIYGVEAVKKFLKDNKFTSIIRAHEAQLDGYKMQMVNRTSGIPRVITIFSAPNYCDVYKNKAACLKFDDNVLNIKQFVDSDHPYYLPNFMDVFQWSLPFVAEKVTDMLANILEFEEDDDQSNAATPASGVVHARGGLLKKKVIAVTKLLRMYKLLRSHNEAIVQLKQLTPNHKVPLGTLSMGKQAIEEAISTYSSVKQADRENEAMPTLEKIRARSESSGRLI